MTVIVDDGGTDEVVDVVEAVADAIADVVEEVADAVADAVDDGSDVDRAVDTEHRLTNIENRLNELAMNQGVDYDTARRIADEQVGGIIEYAIAAAAAVAEEVVEEVLEEVANEDVDVDVTIVTPDVPETERKRGSWRNWW